MADPAVAAPERAGGSIDDDLANLEQQREEFAAEVAVRVRKWYQLLQVRARGATDYYTMSSQGVTHFWQDCTEFQPLESFERDYFLYAQTMRLRLFRQFRMWKAFKVSIANEMDTEAALAWQDALPFLNQTLIMCVPWDLYNHLDP
eukprot:232434-Pelagomonas_calceolata.AAC.5